MIKKRKIPGTNDSTTQPSNLAQGSYTASQGCAVWHTVVDGEVCLGLIDKSSSGFDLNKFLQFNPSLNDACSNLDTGSAYCVDTVVGKGAASAAAVPAPAPAKNNNSGTAPAKSLLAGNSKPQADAQQSATDDEEDCEDDEDDSAAAADDDEDCEEEEDSSADTVLTIKTQSKKVAAPVTQNNTPAPAQNNAPAPEKQAAAPQVQAPAPKVTPTSTYVAPQPTSTYVAPSPSPEPQQPEKPAGGNNGGNGGSFQYNGQQATYYYQNGVKGSCGDPNPDSAMIVAVKSGIMNSGLCGKQVQLRNTATGKTVTAKVADTCPTCVGDGIDLSEAVFSALSDGNLGLGVLTVDYSIL